MYYPSTLPQLVTASTYFPFLIGAYVSSLLLGTAITIINIISSKNTSKPPVTIFTFRQNFKKSVKHIKSNYNIILRPV